MQGYPATRMPCCISYSHFLGYRKGEDGLPEIVPEEEEIVRSIYWMCIEGKSTNAIAKHLTKAKIPTPAGKEVWQRATVESILRNEKYKGFALLQKKFTVDFLPKKMKVNEGEVPQYYVEHSHEAIIAPEEWERVQLELARRKNSEKFREIEHNCGNDTQADIENAAREQSQTAYVEQYDSLAARYEALQSQYDALQQEKKQREIQADAISGCLFVLGEVDLLQIQFSEALWNATVERATVYADERLVFRFMNGAEVGVDM